METPADDGNDARQEVLDYLLSIKNKTSEEISAELAGMPDEALAPLVRHAAQNRETEKLLKDWYGKAISMKKRMFTGLDTQQILGRMEEDVLKEEVQELFSIAYHKVIGRYNLTGDEL